MLTWADSKARERRGSLRVTLGLLLMAFAGVLPLAVRCAAQAFLQADKTPLTLLSQRIYLNLGWQIEAWLRWWPLASVLLLGLGFWLLRRGVKQWKPLPLASEAPAEAVPIAVPEPVPAPVRTPRASVRARRIPSARRRPVAKPKEKPKPKVKPKAKKKPKPRAKTERKR